MLLSRRGLVAAAGLLAPQLPATRDGVPAMCFGFRDVRLGLVVEITLAEEALLFAYPVTTVSQSESGVDLVHQGTCFVAVRRLMLAPGASVTHEATLAAGPI